MKPRAEMKELLAVLKAARTEPGIDVRELCAIARIEASLIVHLSRFNRRPARRPAPSTLLEDFEAALRALVEPARDPKRNATRPMAQNRGTRRTKED